MMGRQLHSKQYSRSVRLAATLGIAAGAAAITGAVLAAPPSGAKGKNVAAKPAVTKVAAAKTSNAPLTQEERIVHLLNRIGFGPRPGDVARIKTMGIDAYIDQQLHPERIDESAMDARIAAAMPATTMADTELAQAYYDGQKANSQLKRLQAEIMENARKAGADEATVQNLSAAQPPKDPQEQAGRVRSALQYATPEQRDQLMELVRERREQTQGGKKGAALGMAQVAMEKSYRAVESEKQLNEVMVDFWSNHFNIDSRKNACRVYKIADEREVIRKHAMGKFRDLLEASAKSPAMLVYLDNFQNVAPPQLTPRQERLRQAALTRMAQNPNGGPAAQFAQQAKNRRGGVNENYARELMELHTLGVDGGYTQKDVQEVARCLTGWGIAGQRTLTPGVFLFNDRAHDNGEKVVLGHTIPAGGGIEDGETVLNIVANHPSTMRFISTKLCRRFVSDDPPKTLVDKCVATWKRTDGDIREIVRTIITSPEFNSRTAYRSKIKSPFEYAVSSVRAIGGHMRLPGEDGAMGVQVALGKGKQARPLQLNAQRTVVGQVSVMGQPLYQCQPPTGYSEDSRKWVSSGALISRLNYALGLTNGNLQDIDIADAQKLMADGELDTPALVTKLENEILNVDISPATRATLLKQAKEEASGDSPMAGVDTTRRLVALVLGSPEFQRR